LSIEVNKVTLGCENKIKVKTRTLEKASGCGTQMPKNKKRMYLDYWSGQAGAQRAAPLQMFAVRP
jgi:hypothetical protein